MFITGLMPNAWGVWFMHTTKVPTTMAVADNAAMEVKAEYPMSGGVNGTTSRVGFCPQRPGIHHVEPLPTITEPSWGIRDSILEGGV